MVGKAPTEATCFVFAAGPSGRRALRAPAGPAPDGGRAELPCHSKRPPLKERRPRIPGAPAYYREPAAESGSRSRPRSDSKASVAVTSSAIGVSVM